MYDWQRKKCLNPYSNGMKIELLCVASVFTACESLNPYSNGMKIEHLEVVLF